jgi:LEA14-like dessication related protein
MSLMQATPVINAYSQDLVVLFNLNRDSRDISKDFLILLKSSNESVTSIPIDDMFEHTLLDSIEVVRETKKSHSFTQMIESDHQQICVSINLDYHMQIDRQMINLEEEREIHIEIAGSVSSICINKNIKCLNKKKNKLVVAIHENIEADTIDEGQQLSTEGK